MSAFSADLCVRLAEDRDRVAIWGILRDVIRTGREFCFPPDADEHAAMSLWWPDGAEMWVCETGSIVAGVYYLKPNQPGLGAHVANAGLMVAPEFRGQGIGRSMGLHALRTARVGGYEAMQFNAVVSTNLAAVALWRSLGFVVIGVSPRAFREPTGAFADLLTMHQSLIDV